MISFKSKFYIQVDGVAMGSLLGPIFVKDWLNKCPIEFEPSFYRRYVDAIFVFLNHLNLLTRFANICLLNTRT